MISNNILINTAYFPPVNYIILLCSAEKVYIEREENYTKQTYRNRCVICSANGPMILSVPILLGSFHKTPVKDIRVDYSKRWQQIHLRTLLSSYKSSPFFEYYFTLFENVITANHSFLLDLNLNSLEVAMVATGIKIPVEYTSEFVKDPAGQLDYRNRISPKAKKDDSPSGLIRYNQVFEDRFGFIPGLSIIDLIFNVGPDAGKYLQSITHPVLPVSS